MRIFTFCLILLSFTFSNLSFACPKVGNFIDFNCDQRVRIAITGDSIVRGVGDTDEEDEGYVERLRKAFPSAEITNLGVPGITSSRLYSSFKRLLQNPEGETSLKSKDADIFIVEVGPNDFWAEEDPALTVRNIKRLVRLLREEIGQDVQASPYFLVATLLPTKRGFQAPFIKKVNQYLLAQSSAMFPVKIRFDTINVNLISEDGLHPSPKGYDAMAGLVRTYIKKDLQRIFASKRLDEDADGVYDFFEKFRYGTDPLNPDSDGDGVTDGAELFINHTDPLFADPIVQ